MESENSETSEPHRFRMNLTHKLNLKDPKKHGFSQFELALHLEIYKTRMQQQ